MEPDRARCVRQRVGARKPVQQRLPPWGRAARCASSRGRCGPVRERRRASNRRVSGAHGSALRLLVELAGVLRDRFPRVGVVSSTAADASPRGVDAFVDVSTMYRRCKDTFPTFRAGPVGSRARSGRRDDGRGGRNSTFSRSCGRRLHAIVARGSFGNQCGAAFRNSQINSDRGDPPF